jgi:hypothetical protein
MLQGSDCRVPSHGRKLFEEFIEGMAALEIIQQVPRKTDVPPRIPGSLTRILTVEFTMTVSLSDSIASASLVLCYLLSEPLTACRKSRKEGAEIAWADLVDGTFLLTRNTQPII